MVDLRLSFLDLPAWYNFISALRLPKALKDLKYIKEE
jgi:hypothetical protein